MQLNIPTITGILAQAVSVRSMKYLQTHSREMPSRIICVHSMNSYPHAYTRQDVLYLWQHQQTAACETPDSSAGEEAVTFHSSQNLCLAPSVFKTVGVNRFLQSLPPFLFRLLRSKFWSCLSFQTCLSPSEGKTGSLYALSSQSNHSWLFLTNPQLICESSTLTRCTMKTGLSTKGPSCS